MRVALYVRVSTRVQSTDMQEAECAEYCDRHGWNIVGRYIDQGISGAKDSRPELNLLMDDARRHRFDTLVVWKLDRFGRSLKHLVSSLADFQKLGISFVSIRDNLDLSTPAGRMHFHMIAAMTEFERELIRERIIAKIAYRKANGLPVGRKRGSTGRKFRNGSREKALKLASEGLSLRQIAKETGYSKSSVQLILSAKRAPSLSTAIPISSQMVSSLMGA